MGNLLAVEGIDVLSRLLLQTNHDVIFILQFFELGRSLASYSIYEKFTYCSWRDAVFAEGFLLYSHQKLRLSFSCICVHISNALHLPEFPLQLSSNLFKSVQIFSFDF